MLLHKYPGARTACTLTCLALLIATSALGADLSPETYAKLRKQAPEAVEFRVRSVHREWCLFCWKGRAIRIQAVVTRTVRSKRGLQPGNLLSIRYRRFRSHNVDGPRPIPLLRKDGSYRGYLQRRSVNKRFGIICTPAARGASFEQIKSTGE